MSIVESTMSVQTAERLSAASSVHSHGTRSLSSMLELADPAGGSENRERTASPDTCFDVPIVEESVGLLIEIEDCELVAPIAAAPRSRISFLDQGRARSDRIELLDFPPPPQTRLSQISSKYRKIPLRMTSLGPMEPVPSPSEPTRLSIHDDGCDMNEAVAATPRIESVCTGLGMIDLAALALCIAKPLTEWDAMNWLEGAVLLAETAAAMNIMSTQARTPGLLLAACILLSLTSGNEEHGSIASISHPPSIASILRPPSIASIQPPPIRADVLTRTSVCWNLSLAELRCLHDSLPSRIHALRRRGCRAADPPVAARTQPAARERDRPASCHRDDPGSLSRFGVGLLEQPERRGLARGCALFAPSVLAALANAGSPHAPAMTRWCHRQDESPSWSRVMPPHHAVQSGGGDPTIRPSDSVTLLASAAGDVGDVGFNRAHTNNGSHSTRAPASGAVRRTRADPARPSHGALRSHPRPPAISWLHVFCPDPTPVALVPSSSRRRLEPAHAIPPHIMNPPPAPASNESAAVGPVMDRLPSRPPSYVSRISSADLPRPDPESLASPPARSRFWSSLPNRLLKQLPRSCINERFVPSSNLRSGLYVLTYLYIVVSFLQLDSSVRDPQQLLQNIYSLVDCSMILLNFVALVSVLVGLSAQRKSIMTVVTIWSFIYDVYGLIAYSLTAAGQIPSTDSASATPLILLILMFAIQVCKIYFSLVIYSYTMYLHLNPQSLEDIDLELHSRSPWDPQDDEDLPVYQPRPPGYSETPHTADSIAPSRTLRRGARSTESMARRNQSTAQSTSTTHETSVPPPPADSIPPVPSTSQAGAPAPDTNTDAAGSASQTDTQSASEPARPDSQEPPARS